MILKKKKEPGFLNKGKAKSPLLNDIQEDLMKYASKEKAEILQRFFKTGPGEYGEGDVFVGVKVPEIRQTAKRYQNCSFAEITKLIKSPVHEQRLLALIILVQQYEKNGEQEKIFDFYLKNTRYVNNWDLVDLSAPHIVGRFLFETKKKRLKMYDLAMSKSLWERRISIISTLTFIRNNDFKDVFMLAKILLKDREDLIHKAVGWMLREVGKRDLAQEENFLSEKYKGMPRTMLRYAIERFPEKKRQAYLKGKI